MENVKNPLDLSADDNGVWVHNGVHTLWLAVRKSGKLEILSWGSKPAMHIIIDVVEIINMYNVYYHCITYGRST